MSNNDYDFSEKAIKLSQNNENNVIGFITQNRLVSNNMICMTPGISFHKSNINVNIEQ